MINLPKEPERSDPNYSCYDDGGVEVEVGEFLWGLTRVMKPDRILETGLYSGISAMYFGLALKENGKGIVDTVEYEQKHAERAKKRIVDHGVQDHVIIHLMPSLDFTPQNYDIIFLDTEPQIRFQEMVKFYPYLNEGGYLFIHDLPRSMCQGRINPDHPEINSWPFGDLPQEIKDMDLRPMYFPTPRGLVGFYKKHSEDYL